MKKKQYSFIDLFAGAGGMSQGFESSGFGALVAIDFDKDSCFTYKKNFPITEVLYKDILKMPNGEIKKRANGAADLIIGGPPCQGFSPLGKRVKNDPRNQLWKHFLRVVEILRPKVWVMENVPELLTSQEFQEIKKKANKLGYHLTAKMLNAADYGVPQRRQRAIVLASMKEGLKHPKATYIKSDKNGLFDQNKKDWKTVKEAFFGLPLKPNGKNWHKKRNPNKLSLLRYKSVPRGGNRFDLPKNLQPECWKNKPTGSTDVFGRLWWNQPSLTIRTEFYKPEKGRYLHPSENRPISIREGARLQTFPDDFEFVGSQTSVGRQIGNAVPCLLAQKIAETIKKHLEEKF